MAGFNAEVSVVVVLNVVMTCNNVAVLEAKVASPGYVARIWSEPTFSVVLLSVAVPPVNAEVPRTVDPAENVTNSPSGTDPLDAVTTAVNVTG